MWAAFTGSGARLAVVTIGWIGVGTGWAYGASTVHTATCYADITELAVSRVSTSGDAGEGLRITVLTKLAMNGAAALGTGDAFATTGIGGVADFAWLAVFIAAARGPRLALTKAVAFEPGAISALTGVIGAAFASFLDRVAIEAIATLSIGSAAFGACVTAAGAGSGCAREGENEVV